MPRTTDEPWNRLKPLLLEGFVLVNFAFLTVDIYLAHSVNRFRHWAEWIPLYFSIAATALIAWTLLSRISRATVRRWCPRTALRRASSRASTAIGLLVGYTAILVGMAGLLFHLNSQFFQQQTIASLVYTAPFVAPLAYCGLGFLLLLNRMVSPRDVEWGLWIVFFALGGFLGNFVLSLADHAQNGFFYISEWIPVVGSALAVGFLTMALFDRSVQFLRVSLLVLGAQAVIGFVGAYFHFFADINGISSSLYENFIHGAPVLAPLLFVNLVVLAVLGIVDVGRFGRHHGAEEASS